MPKNRIRDSLSVKRDLRLGFVIRANHKNYMTWDSYDSSITEKWVYSGGVVKDKEKLML